MNSTCLKTRIRSFSANMIKIELKYDKAVVQKKTCIKPVWLCGTVDTTISF